MKILYFDCFSGISGDMALGALVDIGADLSIIEKQLNEFLPVPVSLVSEKVNVSGITAVNLEINSQGSPRLTHLMDISAIIYNSSLLADDSNHVFSIFERIAQCEARIHGVDINHIHFHEIGAIDTLVDIIGFHLALKQLGIEACYSSPVPLAQGTVPMHHGVYPLPAPATLALLQEVPCYGVEADIELVTPTGAALLTSNCISFGPMPSMSLKKIGYGTGKKRRADIPNVLRIVMGETAVSTANDTVAVLEANIDDMNPEFFSHIFEKFFQMEGSLDMAVDNILMKKNRPGFRIQCLVQPNQVQSFSELLLQETSTLGVRHRLENRIIAPRSFISVETSFGNIQLKTWEDSNVSMRYAPEYDSCKRAADFHRVPLRLVYEEAMRICKTR